MTHIWVDTLYITELATNMRDTIMNTEESWALYLDTQQYGLPTPSGVTWPLSEDPETDSFFCAQSSLAHTIAIIIIYLQKVVDLQVISKKFQKSVNPWYIAQGQWHHQQEPMFPSGCVFTQTPPSASSSIRIETSSQPCRPLIVAIFHTCTRSTQVRGLFIGWTGDKLFMKPSNRKT